MPFKKAIGNMYDWVTHVHTHLAGECPHKCKYCCVQTGVAKLSGRYKGEPRLVESELDANYGTRKIIFIEHLNDLFAEGIKDEWIKRILEHCRKYPENKYVFQTKNPERALNYFTNCKELIFTGNILFGTTIETNRDTELYGNAPSPIDRIFAMMNFKGIMKTFITIEPIMDFDIRTLSNWIIDVKPEFVNIGADSKHCNLPEPSMNKIYELVKILNENNITIKKKSNLERLLR